MHNWSVCVISGVESTNIEKYQNSCTSFTIIFITVFVMMLSSSSQILCDKYDALPCPLFPYFSIWVAKNGSYLLKSSVIPRKLPLWNEPIISSCECKAKPRVLRKTMTSIYVKVLHANIYSPAKCLAPIFDQSSMKVFCKQQHQPKLLGAIAICCVCQFFLLAFLQLLNPLVNLFFVFDKNLQIKQYNFPWLSK